MTQLGDFFSYKDITCRLITKDDINDVVDLVNTQYSYQDSYRNNTRTNFDNMKQHIEESEFYVFTSKNKIIACVYVEIDNTNKIYFGLLTVDQAHSGKGIGKVIVTSVESYAKYLGKKELLLAYMHIAPWLKGYYEKLGFTENGDVWDWDGIKLINMQKHLV